MDPNAWQYPFAALEQKVADMEEAVEKFYETVPEHSEIIASIGNLTQSLLMSSKSLRKADELALLMGDKRIEFPPEFRARLLVSELVKPGLELALGSEALSKARIAHDRMADLLALLVSVSLPAAPSFYLARVAQLYLWGFETEVAAFARAALETALRNRMVDARVHEFVPIKGKYIQLDERIEAAYQAELLSEDEAETADDIRDAGNDLLHSAPKARSTLRTPLDVVRALSVVLQALYQK